MRKLIIFNMVTLDGYFQGPGRDISWHHTDEEFQEFALAQLQEVGAVIFGRVTYEMMAEFWPSEVALESDPQTAEAMNNIPKYVCSRTLTAAEWTNTTLLSGDAVLAIRELKEQDGKDLFVFGSSNLASSLIDAGLVDEFRTMINPVLLGKGNPVYAGISAPLQLEVTGTRPFGNGNVLHYARPRV